METKPQHEPAKLSIRRLVKTELRIVEPMQMEASFEHRLMLRWGGSVIYPKRFNVESYFVFPPQMKVNSNSYPIENFYRDLKSYFNFRIPKLNYREMMGLSDDVERSPIKKILNEISNESLPFTLQRQRFIEEESRIFACSFFTFVRRKVKLMNKSIQDLNSEVEKCNSQKKVGDLDKQFQDSVVKIRNVYSEWLKVAKEIEIKIPSLAVEIFAVDEYLIHNIKDAVLEMDQILQKQADLEICCLWRRRLKAILRKIRMGAIERGYPWVDTQSSKIEMERYFFRRGMLKRRIWSALYLDTRTKPLFFIQRQAAAMFAAGVASIWAVAADILIRSQTGQTRINFKSLGISSFLLASAVILAYIMKDRIKEAGRGFFRKGPLGRIPDNSCKILYSANTFDKDTIHVGDQDEKVTYKGSQGLPHDVMAILEAESVSSLENEDCTVIKYQKRLYLSGERTRKLKRKIRAIYTFYRLNVGAFLGPLDSPHAEHLLPSGNWDAVPQLIPKVYHIDLIIKISGDEDTVSDVYYLYYQLIVDKEGIRRIEEILIPGEMEEEATTDMN